MCHVTAVELISVTQQINWDLTQRQWSLMCGVSFYPYGFFFLFENYLEKGVVE